MHTQESGHAFGKQSSRLLNVVCGDASVIGMATSWDLGIEMMRLMCNGSGKW